MSAAVSEAAALAREAELGVAAVVVNSGGRITVAEVTYGARGGGVASALSTKYQENAAQRGE